MRREEREAIDWAVKMRGNPSAADRKAFEAWYAKPGHAAAYADAEDVQGITDDMSRTRIEADIRARGPTSRPLRWAVATVAVIALAGGTLWHLNQPGDVPQIASGPMVPGQLRLVDGTIVTLMDGAWAEPQFSDTERRVRLHGGRARFEVAHDAARPFIVVVGRSETRALGTIFEIDARAAAPQVRLVKGSVEVRLAGTAKVLRLAPGQGAEVPATGPRLLPEVDLKMTEPVQTTMLAAKNLPLGSVLDAADKAGGKKIRLADPALAALPVSGRFDVADGALLARKLAAALDLQVEDSGEVIILRKK